MEVRILKPCIIDGKAYKPSKKKVTVSDKDAAVLISLGKAEDLSPKKESLSINLDVDIAAFKEMKKEITAKDETIATLTAKVEELTVELEEAKKVEDK